MDRFALNGNIFLAPHYPKWVFRPDLRLPDFQSRLLTFEARKGSPAVGHWGDPWPQVTGSNDERDQSVRDDA